MEISFYFKFTVNGYPKAIEPCVPPLEDSINTFKALSQKIGKERVIWRFDPIILSNLTNRSYIVEKFHFIAQQLRGYTRRVVISFVDCYGKVEKRLKTSSVRFYEIDKGTAFELSREIALIARENEMEIYSTCGNKCLYCYANQ